MMRIRVSAISLLIGLTLPMSIAAEEHTVAQKDKKFDVAELKVKQGDVVHFRNEDASFHNVFSLSEASTFDLGSFPKGESKPVTFKTAGEVDVECAIHPNMTMKVVVE